MRSWRGMRVFLLLMLALLGVVSVQAQFQLPILRPAEINQVGQGGKRTAKPRNSRPVLLVGETREQRESRCTTYKGLTITVDSELGEPGFQRELLERIESLDPRPPIRDLHIEFLSSFEGVYCTGWNAILKDVKRVPSGWEIRLHVYPRLESWEGGHTATTFYTEEVYRFQGGRLEFKGGVLPEGVIPSVSRA